MQNYLKPRIENIIEILKRDFDMIAKKKKNDEWKRDHYRYAFTLAAQRMYDMLNSNLTGEKMHSVSPSTQKELEALCKRIDEMIE